MLTLFSSPKPFVGHIKVIQSNAIKSWTLLEPKPEVILFGNDKGTKEIAEGLALQHISEVPCNEYGTPRVDGLFKQAQKEASYDTLCYVNSDIILIGDLAKTVNTVRKVFDKFLIVGLRTNLDIEEPIDFESGWQDKLKKKLNKQSVFFREGGADYFIFKKGLWQEIPSFALGRVFWDNWLIYSALMQKVPVIDATEVITAIHQNHNNLYVVKKTILKKPEVEYNRCLAGLYHYAFPVQASNYIFTLSGIKPALSFRSLVHRIETFPVLNPNLRILYWIIRPLLNVLRFLSAIFFKRQERQ